MSPGGRLACAESPLARSPARLLVVGLICALVTAVFPVWGACPHDGPLQRVGLESVVDGDTLVLTDGRRLRLIGINTPERGRQGEADEPFAGQATNAVKRFLAGADTIMFQLGQSTHDRYGRLLAHVYRPVPDDLAAGAANLACHLLAGGLGWRIAEPPNLAYQTAFAEAERRARVSGRGIWAEPRARTTTVDGVGGGFRLLRATIVRVDFGRDWWLETDADFVVRVASKEQSYFDRAVVAGWEAKAVEVRGWMYRRSGRRLARQGYDAWVLMLKHPSSLDIVY